MSESLLPQYFASARVLAEQIETYLGTPIDLHEDTEDDRLQRDMRAMALLRQSAETLKAVVRSAEQSFGDAPITDEVLESACIAAHPHWNADYRDYEPVYTEGQKEQVRKQIRAALEAARDHTSQPKGPTPGKNVLETVEQYRREHPGAIERAEAEMIAEEAGLYDYTCPHGFTVFRAIYGQDFPNCPYCAKQLNGGRRARAEYNKHYSQRRFRCG